MKLNPGRYKAIVIDKDVTENSKGNAQVVIRLEIEHDGTTTQMNYYGQTEGKALEFTLKALVACGIKGNNLFDEVTIGKEVSVTVDQDKNDPSKVRIAWINKPMGEGLGKTFDPAKGRAAFAKFEGALAALRKDEPKAQKSDWEKAADEIDF